MLFPLRRVLLILGAAALPLLAPTQGRAQAVTCGEGGTCTHTVSVEISDLLQLTVGSAATELTAPVPAEIGDGPVVDPGPALSVTANRDWVVQISSGPAGSWTATGGARADKPVSDLGWRLDPGDGFSSLAQAPATVSSGGAQAEAVVGTIEWGTNWEPVDTEGSYELDVIFTIIPDL